MNYKTERSLFFPFIFLYNNKKNSCFSESLILLTLVTYHSSWEGWAPLMSAFIRSDEKREERSRAAINYKYMGEFATTVA